MRKSSIANRICVYKDGHRKYIAPSELDSYLSKGYQKSYKKENSVLSNLILNISYDDLYNYYEVENHLEDETAEHFKIKKCQVRSLLTYYNIVKSTKARSMNSKKGKLAKYGDENYNNREKVKATCLDKHGVEWPCLTKQCRDKTESSDIRQKAINTYANNNNGKLVGNSGEVGLEHGLPDTAEKRYATMKKNHSFNTSKDEKKMYEFLCKMYGEQDVKHHYSIDERYPFECDFYIKSLDLFIELNCHGTHGNHPFNSDDKDDISLLETGRSRQGLLKNGKQNSYYVAEDVGTVRDVRKRETAKANNLKFVEFYTIDERQWYDTLSKESIL